MAVPKRKVSKARRNSRRANWKLTVPNLVSCPKCGELVMSHKACRACGTYKSKVVLEVE